MTIAVLTFMLAGDGWQIDSPDGKFHITAEEACISGKCKPAGKMTVDGRGMWFLESIDVDLRWASLETVEIRTADSGWLASEFKVETQVELPPTEIVDRVTRWDRGVLPGLWVQATDACQADTKAWLYRPILKEAPASMVHKVDGKLTVTEKAHLAPCKGKKDTSGVYPGEAP